MVSSMLTLRSVLYMHDEKLVEAVRSFPSLWQVSSALQRSIRAKNSW